MPWQRRNFLGALLTFLSASSIAGSARAPEDLPAPAETLLRAIRDRRAARVIGDAYLSLYPEERNRDFLTHALIAPNDSHATPLATAGHARALLRKMRKSDFEGGDTVMLDGWILGRSECRLCALAALT
jgi:hypothetical protein